MALQKEKAALSEAARKRVAFEGAAARLLV